MIPLYSQHQMFEKVKAFSNKLTQVLTSRYPGKIVALSAEEETQLYYLSRSDDYVTPQSLGSDANFFEIRRSLTRYMAFELLWNLAQNFAVSQSDLEKPYLWLIENQRHNALTFDDFQALLSKFRSFIKLCQEQGGDEVVNQVYAVLRATCFFTKTIPTDKILEEQGITPPLDSEKYLTEIAQIAQEKQTGIPLIDKLTGNKFLPYAFLSLHLRAMLFSEGPENNMLKFFEELKWLPDEHSLLALHICSMRWLINILGFEEGQGAPFYTHAMHILTFEMLEGLLKRYHAPGYPLITQYLYKRAEFAGILVEDLREKQLLGHLIACNARLVITTEMLGKQVKQGYENFKTHHPEIPLAEIYHQFLQSDLPTPTYTPAIVANAYKLLAETTAVNTLFQQTKCHAEETPLEVTIELACGIFSEIYLLANRYPHKIIAAAELARNKLEPLINTWLTNDRKLQATGISEKNEILMEANIPPKFAVAISLGELISTDMNLTIKAFEKLLAEKYQISANTFAEKWPELFKQKLLPLIGKIRLGVMVFPIKEDLNIDSMSLQEKEEIVERQFQDAFCQAMSEAFEREISFTAKEFNDAWCAMCPITKENFDDIVSLQNDREIKIFFYSNTNSFQYRYILKQFHDYDKNFTLAEKNVFLSFRIGKQSAELLAEMTEVMQQEREKESVNDIIYISGDPKQVQNAIFQQVAVERSGENSAFINQQDRSYHFIRDKKQHPRSYLFVKNGIEEIKTVNEKKSARKRLE